MDEIFNYLAQQYVNKIDEEIKEFLNKQGYKNITVDSLKNLIKEWKKEGKQLRCEIFCKYLSQDVDKVSMKILVIPFFDLIPAIISRKEIYEALKLKDKGYLI